MESYDSVLAFGRPAQELPRLDIAMLNAACFKYEFETSPVAGNESSLQVNHLSAAFLSLLLLPVLKKTSLTLKRPTCLTLTSSEVYMLTHLKEKEADKILARLNDKNFFGDTIDRYSVTKLLNVFWVVELVSRLR
jgi:retinol dehydrogenase-12